MGRSKRRNLQRRRKRERERAATAVAANAPGPEPIGADTPEPSFRPSPPESPGGQGADMPSAQVATQENKLVSMMLNSPREFWPIDTRGRKVAMAICLKNMNHPDGRVAMVAVRNYIAMNGQNIDIANAFDRLKVDKAAASRPRRRVSVIKIMQPAPMAGMVIDAQPTAIANASD